MFAAFRKKKTKEPEKNLAVSADLRLQDDIRPKEELRLQGPEKATTDEDINGLEMKEYSRKYQLSEKEIWDKIKRGEMVARTENGFLYVYGQHLPPASLPARGSAQAFDEAVVKGLQEVAKTESQPAPAFNEFMLYIRQENQKIWDVAQLSLKQANRMMDEVLTLKEEMLHQKQEQLARKDEQIAELTNRIASASKENRALKQNIEDLNILVTTLSPESSFGAEE